MLFTLLIYFSLIALYTLSSWNKHFISPLGFSCLEHEECACLLSFYLNIKCYLTTSKQKATGSNLRHRTHVTVHANAHFKLWLDLKRSKEKGHRRLWEAAHAGSGRTCNLHNERCFWNQQCNHHTVLPSHSPWQRQTSLNYLILDDDVTDGVIVLVNFCQNCFDFTLMLTISSSVPLCFTNFKRGDAAVTLHYHRATRALDTFL